MPPNMDTAAGLQGRDSYRSEVVGRYRWVLRLRRRIISITSNKPAVSQRTVCMTISFMVFLLSYPLNDFIIGNRYLNTCNKPGPAATTSMAGKMKKKIGN